MECSLAIGISSSSVSAADSGGDFIRTSSPLMRNTGGSPTLMCRSLALCFAMPANSSWIFILGSPLQRSGGRWPSHGRAKVAQDVYAPGAIPGAQPWPYWRSLA